MKYHIQTPTDTIPVDSEALKNYINAYIFNTVNSINILVENKTATLHELSNEANKAINTALDSYNRGLEVAEDLLEQL